MEYAQGPRLVLGGGAFLMNEVPLYQLGAAALGYPHRGTSLIRTPPSVNYGPTNVLGEGGIFHERGTPVGLGRFTSLPPHSVALHQRVVCTPLFIQGFLAHKKQRPSRTLQ